MTISPISNVNSNYYRNLSFGENKQDTSAENKPKLSRETKVLIGAGLAAVAAVGIYIATRGKVKNITPEIKNIQERTLKNGNKVTKEVVDTEKGKKTIMTVLDKNGKVIVQKEKEIIRGVNKTNGNKYITKVEKYLSSDKENITQINRGDEVIQFLGDGKIITNKYYNNAGEKLLETEHQNLSMFRNKPHNQKTRTIYKNGAATDVSVTNYGKLGGVESENRGLRTRIVSNGEYTGSDKTKFNNHGVLKKQSTK